MLYIVLKIVYRGFFHRISYSLLYKYDNNVLLLILFLSEFYFEIELFLECSNLVLHFKDILNIKIWRN